MYSIEIWRGGEKRAEARGESEAALLYRGAEWIYLFSGGLTGAYMIKLYICLFWERHPTQQIAYEAKKPYMGKLSALALFLSAAIVPALGLTPNLTMDKIADIAGGFLNAAAPAHAVHYFSLTNIKGACISLAIGEFHGVMAATTPSGS